MEVKINDINLLKYCQERIYDNNFPDFGKTFPKDKFTCFGQYSHDGSPLWVVVLFNFKEGHDCVIDFVLNIKGMFSPLLLKRIGRVVSNYVFEQASLTRCNAFIRKSNIASLKLAKACGFKEEGLRRFGYKNPMEDMYLLGMLKSDCPWI